MTTCCSTQCKKRYDCTRHCFNSVSTYPSEDYYTFGYGSISSDDCKVEHWCGELGEYKMFVPIQKKEEVVPFPFQYINEYLSGGMLGWDEALEKTIHEVNRLIKEHLEKQM